MDFFLNGTKTIYLYQTLQLIEGIITKMDSLIAPFNVYPPSRFQLPKPFIKIIEYLFKFCFHPAVVLFHIQSGQAGKSGLGTLRRGRLAAPFHHAEQFHGIVVPGLDIGELWRDFGTDLFFLESGR